MQRNARIEAALEAAITRASTSEAPPLLAAAVRHAVFPGGARVRPQLCLAVASACGDDAPAIADAAAAAVEFMHCASLVHDDLPCFDDASVRRGRPSVHAAFGAPLAVLAGDALIVLAFDSLAAAAAAAPQRTAPLIAALARGVGMPGGIAAGQAWESEPDPDVAAYHQAKTAALFIGATELGALSAGVDARPWRALGVHLGAAYQAADDLLDAHAANDEAGKPVGRDAALSRPSIVAERGVAGALAHLRGCIAAAIESVPECPGAQELRDLVRATALRLAPKSLTGSKAARSAA
ncbi:MAG: geranylgeranyl pyrophosphate synthase [Alphaproteobacteria bacterium]|nr:geranylgeranyl pyrophosphate synthase [Alphaproteobacteria bacterium]